MWCCACLWGCLPNKVGLKCSRAQLRRGKNSLFYIINTRGRNYFLVFFSWGVPAALPPARYAVAPTPKGAGGGGRAIHCEP